MAEEIRVFGPEAMEQIRTAVRIVLAGKSPGTSTGRERQFNGYWLARAMESQVAGNLATFKVMKLVGTKGSEIVSDVEIDAYVRRGMVFNGMEYVLLAVCYGTDSAYEVVNPSMEFLGVTDASIAKGASGNVTLYTGDGGLEVPGGLTISCLSRFTNIGSGIKVRASWSEWARFWEITSGEC